MNYLLDHETEELVFGGGAGGGKSYLGCLWMVISCLKYEEFRGLIGRSVLKQLKQSTLLTLLQVCKDIGLKANEDFKYNAQEGTVYFIQTDATIYLKDLYKNPSDPEYDSLGSTEYTYYFIDEASQVEEKAKNVLNSRLRWKHKEFNTIAKGLQTCNPTKNYLYTSFYKPWKEGTLPGNKKFIQALVDDNHYLPKSYKKTLQGLDKVSQERLLYGNWEYDDDPARLVDFDAISDLFTNTLKDTKDLFITADIARFGADRTILIYWEGFTAKNILSFKKQGLNITVQEIQNLAEQHSVPYSRIIIDEDGVGGGVVDNLPGCKGFVNGSRAVGGENYQNLKTQCYYEMAKKINHHEMAIETDNIEVKKMIIEELEQVKADKIDKDQKLSLISKDKVKGFIGRSPDISDALAMRFYKFPTAGIIDM